MPRYIASNSMMSIQWRDFQSRVNMLLYYVAVADNSQANPDDCEYYVSIHTDYLEVGLQSFIVALPGYLVLFELFDI